MSNINEENIPWILKSINKIAFHKENKINVTLYRIQTTPIHIFNIQYKDRKKETKVYH